MSFTVDDLPVFLNCQEFATEAVIRGRCIAGLEGHTAVMVSDVETMQTVFTCASGAILEIAHDERLTLRDRIYRIVGIRPDGTGLTTFILEFVCTLP